MDELDRSGAALALLGDDLRRRIYRVIRAAPQPVTREEVAAATEISRKLAAFHLDRMVEVGLLTASYARPAGRGGPGAGRTAKHYRTSELQVEVSLPERHYDLVGSLLVEAITDPQPGEGPGEAAIRVSKERGMEVGRQARRTRGLRSAGPEGGLALAEEVLSEYGYEPYRTDAKTVALRNCPFHSLAKQSQELVCSMNRSLVEGVAQGLGSRTLEARLECVPGDCCVTLARR
jgi:predicted ArsR family transcriptional regulator